MKFLCMEYGSLGSGNLATGQDSCPAEPLMRMGVEGKPVAIHGDATSPTSQKESKGWGKINFLYEIKRQEMAPGEKTFRKITAE